MSPDYCQASGKVMHATAAAAMRKGGGKANGLHPYRCPDCSSFHLTRARKA